LHEQEEDEGDLAITHLNPKHEQDENEGVQ